MSIPKESNYQPGMDPTLDYMILKDKKIDRETYLEMAYPDRVLDPTQLLMPEEEQMIPEFLQLS